MVSAGFSVWRRGRFDRRPRRSSKVGESAVRQTTRPEFTQTRDILRSHHDPAAGHDDRRLNDLQFLQHRGFFLAESLFPEPDENFADRHFEGGRDHFVGIESWPAFLQREESADR